MTDTNPVIINFVDTETTGLDPNVHWPWEIAVIQTEYRAGERSLYELRRLVVQIPVPKRLREHIDPVASEINGYEERAVWRADATEALEYIESGLKLVHKQLSGGYMAGNVISFDAEMLNNAFQYVGLPRAPWHYHLIDVEAVACGHLNIGPPWRSVGVSEKLGVKTPADAHTAMADARWALNLYMAAMGLSFQPMIDLD